MLTLQPEVPALGDLILAQREGEWLLGAAVELLATGRQRAGVEDTHL